LTAAPPFPERSPGTPGLSRSGAPSEPGRDGGSEPPVDTWDPDLPYRLDSQVALRPEPFGALAYHYGTRRLTFLRSPVLVELVRNLEHHDCAAGAVEATVPPEKRSAFLRALADLTRSGFIRPHGGHENDAH
jgi:putative mycofactocin binding protein MftB